jgi:hypothetical protein
MTVGRTGAAIRRPERQGQARRVEHRSAILPGQIRGAGTAEERDELAPFHSAISSARRSSVGGAVRPIAFAALRLMPTAGHRRLIEPRALGAASYTWCFPIALITLDPGAGIVFAADWRRSIYWFAAAVLTAAVTF